METLPKTSVSAALYGSTSQELVILKNMPLEVHCPYHFLCSIPYIFVRRMLKAKNVFRHV
jgi:GTP cyclohydrolase I